MVRTTTRNRNQEATNREPAQATTRSPASSQTQDAPPRLTADSSAAASGSAQVPARIEQRELGGVNARNAFEAYGQSMSMTSITGTLIKFNKGDWVTGDDEDLEENLELVANMDELMCGWIKWVDQRPAEQIMGRVADGYQPPRRGELGDTDQSQWEVDNEGRPRDPWQFSNYIVMKEPGQAATEDFLYTFATSSKGGLGAIGALCREYGREMRSRPDDYPIVRLGADSYRHPEYGRTHVPVLDVIGWEPKAQFAAVAEVSRGERQDEEREQEPAREAESPPARAQEAATGGRRRR